LFRKKGRLRKEINDSLLNILDHSKNEWLKQKRVVDSSIEPSFEVLHQLKLAEAKYFFLLKEARYKKITYNKQNLF
jgi:uncharacterized protein YktB (UPF0637 family)